MNDLSFALKQKRQPWRPIPGSSQELALDSRADVTLYHGARGPGKTDTQLMRYYRRVGKGYGAYWRGIIFDREYKQLDDLVNKSKRWFSGWDDGARYYASTSDKKWVWPTGEELLFRVVKKTDDYWNYHGHEYPYIGWNELCKYPTPELFDRMMSINRTSFTPAKDNPNVPPLRMEVFGTANPYGPGHGWVKQRFIDPAPNGKVIRKPTSYFDPVSQRRETYEVSQVAIFGSYKENIYLPPAYIAGLENERDPNVRRAWLLGDWDIVVGGAIVDVWDRRVHVLPHFSVPASWRVDRSFDWGSTHPSATIWWAEADGTEAVMRDGTTFCPPPGTLIAIAELYTADSAGTNVGLKWSATKIAQTIRQREDRMRALGLITGDVWPGPADNQISSVTNVEVDTMETLMKKQGVRWTKSDKSSHSRPIGLQLIRDRLEFTLEWARKRDARGPGLFFMNNCVNSIGTIPMLPRDETNPDDVDSEAEDHLYDALRYRVLAGGRRWTARIDFRFPT